MKTEIESRGQVSVVRAMGRLTLGDGEDELLRAVTSVLQDGGRRVVLNLDGLSMLDSAGVGEIVTCYKRADENGAVLKIALRPEGLVHHLFKRSGLDHALEVIEDEARAIASFS